MLHATSILTPIATLAEITVWSQKRLTNALAQLDEQLRPVGLVLHYFGSRVAVRGRGDIDRDQVAAAVRSHLYRDGLSLGEIRPVRRILDGGSPTNPNNAEQVALGVLANARLIEPDGPGKWKAHPDVLYGIRRPVGPELTAS